MVIDGAMTGPHFEAYLTRVLGPELRPGDLVVVGNLRAHAMASVAGFQARAVYRPPYRPALTPIEQAFAQAKAELRRRVLRTVESLWAAFGESLDWVTAEQAHNYFQHAGFLLD